MLFLSLPDTVWFNWLTKLMNLYHVFQYNDMRCNDCGPKGCPVIVHIHGGAFHFWSSQMFGPKYLMQNGEVIFVTFNYRLGPLGQ